MSFVTASIICSNDQCEADVDVEGYVTIESQRHSFWGQSVSEDCSDVEILTKKCEECGTEVDEETASEKLFEEAV